MERSSRPGSITCAYHSFYGVPYSTSDVVARGFELGCSTSWDSGFVRVGYANTDTEVSGLEAVSYYSNYLIIPLGEVITLQAAQELDSSWLVGCDADIALDYTIGHPAEYLDVDVEGSAVVNAFVEFELQNIEGLIARAEVNNIFEEAYSSRASYGQDNEV